MRVINIDPALVFWKPLPSVILSEAKDLLGDT